MKIEQVLPPRPDNAVLALQTTVDTPTNAVLIATYGAESLNGATDLMLRTGKDGWLWIGRYSGAQAGLQREPVGSYYTTQEAQTWVLHHLEQGAKFHRVLMSDS